MNLVAPFLTIETVQLDIEVSSQKRLFEYVSLLFESAYGLAHGEVFDSLIARERIGSTCVGASCALPHGRVSGIDQPAICFVRTKDKLHLDSPDGRGVRMFLCMIVPEHSAEDYLRILREAAAALNDKNFRSALLSAKTTVEACELWNGWTTPEDLHADHALDEATQEMELTEDRP